MCERVFLELVIQIQNTIRNTIFLDAHVDGPGVSALCPLNAIAFFMSVFVCVCVCVYVCERVFLELVIQIQNTIRNTIFLDTHVDGPGVSALCPLNAIAFFVCVCV